MPPASIGSAPNARCSKSRRTARPPGSNGPVRRATLSGFFTDVTDPSRLTAVGPRRRRLRSRRWRPCVEQAEAIRGEVLALRHEIESARFSERAADRRLIPEPEIVAGTKSSTAAGGDHRQRHHRARHDSPVRSRAPRTGARARARPLKREARLDAFRLTLRGQIAALRARRHRAARGGRTLSRRGHSRRGSNRAHCAGQLRRRRAGDSGTARRPPGRRHGQDSAGVARRRRPAGRDRAGIRQRLGDSINDDSNPNHLGSSRSRRQPGGLRAHRRSLRKRKCRRST